MGEDRGRKSEESVGDQGDEREREIEKERKRVRGGERDKESSKKRYCAYLVYCDII